MKQLLEPVVAREAEARNAPTGKIAEANLAAIPDDSAQGRAAGVGCANDAANTASADASDGDSVLFEHLQDTQMREASSETAS